MQVGMAVGPVTCAPCTVLYTVPERRLTHVVMARVVLRATRTHPCPSLPPTCPRETRAGQGRRGLGPTSLHLASEPSCPIHLRWPEGRVQCGFHEFLIFEGMVALTREGKSNRGVSDNR